MRSGDKKAIIICAIAIIAIIVLLIIGGNKGKEKGKQEEQVIEEYVEVLADGTRLNTSETLNKDKKLDDLTFQNIQLTNSNGQSVLLADVTNTGKTKTELTLVNIIILDKAGKELGTVGGIIIPLEPGQSTQFNSSMTMDYANAYDFKVVKQK
ncbi:MAG: hypothetical protein IJ223_04685 [Clostridia bacterium]|nr:hypothetical protein [Clostridia bacterium]